jgi:hypothetical protein
MYASPESPRWLASKNRSRDALAASERLWGAQAAMDMPLTPGAPTFVHTCAEIYS